MFHYTLLEKKDHPGDWMFSLGMLTEGVWHVDRVNMPYTRSTKHHKINKNWVRNISPHTLEENEMHILSYGLKHFVTHKYIPTNDIVLILCGVHSEPSKGATRINHG